MLAHFHAAATSVRTRSFNPRRQVSVRLAKIEQLDALRAIAVFLVVLQHYLPNYRVGSVPYAWAGVDLFFVISGYLITAILLRQKAAISSKALIIKNFIIKRVLRLFPIYYLFLTFFALAMAWFGLWSWDPGQGIYYYTYTANILMFMEGHASKQLYHVWSLSVEEQFYLIWPWLVLFLSDRVLLRVLLILVLASFLFKSFVAIPDMRLLTPYHFDTLGGGALIALLQPGRGRAVRWIEGHAAWLLSAGLAMLAIHHFLFNVHALLCAAILMITITLVVGGTKGFGGAAGRLLDMRWLGYIGRISYGIYLYHKPIPLFVQILLDRSGIQVHGIILVLLSMALTFAIAHFSFVWIEQRFLKLKDHFDL